MMIKNVGGTVLILRTDLSESFKFMTQKKSSAQKLADEYGLELEEQMTKNSLFQGKDWLAASFQSHLHTLSSFAKKADVIVYYNTDPKSPNLIKL